MCVGRTGPCRILPTSGFFFSPLFPCSKFKGRPVARGTFNANSATEGSRRSSSSFSSRLHRHVDTARVHDCMWWAGAARKQLPTNHVVRVRIYERPPMQTPSAESLTLLFVCMLQYLHVLLSDLREQVRGFNVAHA